LLNPPVEGRLIGSPTKVEVGDKVKVRLSRVDIVRGFIDFVRSGNGN
jgi:translation initiation factor IF-1